MKTESLLPGSKVSKEILYWKGDPKYWVKRKDIKSRVIHKRFYLLRKKRHNGIYTLLKRINIPEFESSESQSVSYVTLFSTHLRGNITHLPPRYHWTSLDKKILWPSFCVRWTLGVNRVLGRSNVGDKKEGTVPRVESNDNNGVVGFL